MHRQKGFTLVEILFVLVIIAGVMAYAVPAYKRTQARAAYDAATGTLVDIGTAIQAMKRDLTMQNYSFTIYPFPANNSAYYQLAGNETVGDDLSGTTLKQFLSVSTAATRDARFVGSLFKFGYLEPFSNPDYEYYAIRGTSTTVCNSKCRTSGTVACMCKKSGYSATDCYYGAMFLNTGNVQRIDGDNCGS